MIHQKKGGHLLIKTQLTIKLVMNVISQQNASQQINSNKQGWSKAVEHVIAVQI